MSKTYHILNGDALFEFFPAILPGEIVVARECLIDGPTNGNSLTDFWETRATFIASEFGEEKSIYFDDVAAEFEKIKTIPAGSEVNFWFEEDLFCQVNLWFCISLLEDISENLTINIVKPPLRNGEPDWRGFGAMSGDELAIAYQERERLSSTEIRLLSKLWQSFKIQDINSLQALSNSDAVHFPMLKEVVEAHLERISADNLSGRPEKVLKDIITGKATEDFKIIFSEFGKREGIYGFGDWQVERLIKKLADAGVISPIK